MPSISAVLLAGGKSQRMGRDKALLSVPGSDQLLWQRQLGALEDLRPEQIFWSGPKRPGLPKHVQTVADALTNAGPLAGISACLELVSSDLLVVLAVDLPLMDAGYLRNLAKCCTSKRGVVPQRNDLFEPLAAIYPGMVRELAADRLRQGRYALQEFVREAIRRELVEAVPIRKADAGKFKNLNSPEDVSYLK